MTRAVASPVAARQVEQSIPNGEFYRDGRLQIVIAGLDKNVRPVAVEVANDRLREKMGNRGFKGFVQRVWYGSFAKETYLSRETVKAKQEILENDNLYHHKGGDDELDRKATTERFAHEYDELIHEEAGEHRTVLGGPEGDELMMVIEALITTYVEDKGEDADESFEEDKKRLISEMVADGRLSPDLVGEGLLYADNLLQIAQNVKAMIDHKQFVNAREALQNADITLGEARVGARTEMDRRLSERVAEKLSKSNLPFPNEVAIATGVAIAYTATAYAAKRGLGSALGTIAPGLAGGAIAGFREAKTVKEQRSMVGRKIEGGELDMLTGSDAELAETYEVIEARQLIDSIAELYDHEGKIELSDLASVHSAVSRIAELRADIRLADQGKQLLVFVDEEERFGLDLALAKAERDVSGYIDAMPEGDRKLFGDYAYGHENETPSAGRNYLMSIVDNLEKTIERDDISARDRLYRKMRNKRVAMAAVRGTVIGGSIGFAAQELMALVNPDEQGLIEGALGHNIDAHHQTALENLVHPNIPVVHAEQGTLHLSGELAKPVELGVHSNIALPSEFHVAHDGNELTITGPQGVRVEHIALTADGHLTSGSEQLLKESGFSIAAQNEVISHTVQEHVTVSPEQFLHDHPNLNTNVTRDFWYKGDSQGLSYEVGPNGSYTIHLDGMNSEITAANGAQMSLHEAAAHGDIKAALSLTYGTQTHVVMVPIDAQGNAEIPAHSELSQLFENTNGTVGFKGQYLEVVQHAGKDPSGVTHIRPIATAVGPNSVTHLAETKTVLQHQTKTDYTLRFTHAAPQAAVSGVSPDVAIPPYVPDIPGRLPQRSVEQQPVGGDMLRSEEANSNDDAEAIELEEALGLKATLLSEVMALGVSWEEKMKAALRAARQDRRKQTVVTEVNNQGEGEHQTSDVQQATDNEGERPPRLPEQVKIEVQPVPVVPERSENGEHIDMTIGNIFRADFGKIGRYSNFNGVIRLQNINDGGYYQFTPINERGDRIPGQKMSLRAKQLKDALEAGVFQAREKEIAPDTTANHELARDVVAEEPRVIALSQESGQSLGVEALIPGQEHNADLPVIEEVDSGAETNHDGFRYVPDGTGFAFDNFAPYELSNSRTHEYDSRYSGNARGLALQVLNYVGNRFGERNNEQALTRALEIIHSTHRTPEQRVLYDEAGQLLNDFMTTLRHEHEPEPVPPVSKENSVDRYTAIKNLQVGEVFREHFRNEPQRLVRYMGNNGDSWQFEPVNDQGEALVKESGLIMNGETTIDAFNKGELTSLLPEHPLYR